MSDLAGKVALVTGALGGMGAEICAQLAERGAGIAAVDVVEKPGDQPLDRVKAHGHPVAYYRTDISDQEQVSDLCKSISSDLGGIDIVVNCAGLVGRRDATISDPLAERKFYLDEPYDEWLSVMKVNVWGSNVVATTSYPYLKARGGGSIVTISSVAGRFGASAAALSYTASKSALIGLGKQWAKMFGQDGIRSNIIAPGPTRTPMLDSMSPEKLDMFRNATLTGRISETSDIAGVVCFLASEASANITGTVIDVNGGSWIPG